MRLQKDIEEIINSGEQKVTIKSILTIYTNQLRKNISEQFFVTKSSALKEVDKLYEFTMELVEEKYDINKPLQDK
jgi:hypothetical protein